MYDDSLQKEINVLGRLSLNEKYISRNAQIGYELDATFENTNV